jgi:hypothetical protein
MSFMDDHLKAYLASGGAEGHILDLSSAGGHAITTHCLIKVAGRKSGTPYVRPLIYGNVGGEIVIVASKGGADTDPEWYLNIRESDMTHLFPPYLGYQTSTTRHIPVVMLRAERPIPVFTE